MPVLKGHSHLNAESLATVMDTGECPRVLVGMTTDNI